MSALTKQASGAGLASLSVMAWRNLWRNYRRTGIMIMAISIGVWAMIFMSALMRGMVEDILQRGVQQLPGHVQLHHPDYPDDPSVVNSLPENVVQAGIAEAGEAVSRWYARIKVPAIIASERESRGLVLLGVDPLAEHADIFANAQLLEGEFLNDPEDQGIVIGERLSDRLETRLGKRVVVMSQNPQNDIVERGLRVSGIYQAEFRGQEERYAYMSKNTLQSLLEIDGQVSEVAIFGQDYRDLSELLSGLQSTFDSNTGMKPEAWNEVNPYLGGAVRLMDGFVLFFIVIIFLALSFGLANTLVMAVFERVREIGLMLALGMRPGMVLGQIMIESVYLLGLGLALGNLLAWLSVVSIADGVDISAVAEGLEMAGMGTVLYPLMLSKDVISANVIVIVMGAIVSFMPAWHAAHYDPIRALTKPT
ncbi:MAG: ABC transporter permease [Gammaproteobacteria bacterium]|nr:ABC transporter permease [Gammaproteobacteria bacterium]